MGRLDQTELMLGIWTDTDPEEDVMHLQSSQMLSNLQPRMHLQIWHDRDSINTEETIVSTHNKHFLCPRFVILSLTHTHVTHPSLLSNLCGLWRLILTLLQVSLVVPGLVLFSDKLVHSVGSEHQCVAVNGGSKMRRSIKAIQMHEIATSALSRRSWTTFTVALKTHRLS